MKDVLEERQNVFGKSFLGTAYGILMKSGIIFFPQGKKMPRYVEYLGQLLPYATMGLLMVYCRTFLASGIK